MKYITVIALIILSFLFWYVSRDNHSPIFLATFLIAGCFIAALFGVSYLYFLSLRADNIPASTGRPQTEVDDDSSEPVNEEQQAEFRQTGLAVNVKSWNIRRILIGARGTGKNHYVTYTILPQIANYVIIDLNDEYCVPKLTSSGISQGQRLIFDNRATLKKINEQIGHCISRNPGRIFIIPDNIHYFTTAASFRKLLDTLHEHKCGYVLGFLSFQSASAALKENEIDLIYDFGSPDSTGPLASQYENRIVKVLDYGFKHQSGGMLVGSESSI